MALGKALVTSNSLALFHRWQHWRIASRHKRDTRDTTVAFICHHISSSRTGTNVYMRKYEKGFQYSALACSWNWDSSLLNHSEYFMLSPHLTKGSKGCHGIMWHPKPSFVRFWCRCPSPPVPPRLAYSSSAAVGSMGSVGSGSSTSAFGGTSLRRRRAISEPTKCLGSETPFERGRLKNWGVPWDSRQEFDQERP